MKKSDMIYLIASEVLKQNNSHYMYEADEHAKKILDAIIKAGMTCDWEPEDE
jgi:hypothetical protein